MRNRRIVQRWSIVFITAVTWTAAAQRSYRETFELDAVKSTVQYTVDSTLHTVHGTFQLRPASMQFDPAGGATTGELVVTAASGDSGNRSRDQKMTREVLEAEKYPEIIFTPQRMKGSLAPSGSSEFQLEGILTLHGEQHPMTLDVKARVEGQVLTADTSFAIPYIDWGLKNPSALFLRVNRQVDIHIHVVGQLRPAMAAKSHVDLFVFRVPHFLGMISAR